MHAVSLCFHKMMATALTAKTACPESLITVYYHQKLMYKVQNTGLWGKTW
jgi:hypothetical protein